MYALNDCMINNRLWSYSASTFVTNSLILHVVKTYNNYLLKSVIDSSNIIHSISGSFYKLKSHVCLSTFKLI